MTITNLRLVNFRSFDDQSFDFTEGTNIIIGPNAVGKTSILEAIHIMNTGKSFRQEQNLIKENKDWARIDMNTSDNNTKTIKLTPATKTFEIDKEQASQQKAPTILFEPNELFLFYQNPGERRTYIDNRIAETTRGFRQTLNEYKKTLSQRNNLLKAHRGVSDTMFVWNLKLAQLGQQIATQRQEYIDTLNRRISPVYQQISGSKETVAVEYSSIIPINDSYVSSLLKKLEQNQERDLLTGFTNFGPHRDDIVFKIFGNGVKNIA
ncbi:MAG: DNA replication and repair protein RecF, partial [Patescibacteria group bacterium]